MSKHEEKQSAVTENRLLSTDLLEALTGFRAFSPQELLEKATRYGLNMHDNTLTVNVKHLRPDWFSYMSSRFKSNEIIDKLAIGKDLFSNGNTLIQFSDEFDIEFFPENNGKKYYETISSHLFFVLEAIENFNNLAPETFREIFTEFSINQRIMFIDILKNPRTKLNEEQKFKMLDTISSYVSDNLYYQLAKDGLIVKVMKEYLNKAIQKVNYDEYVKFSEPHTFEEVPQTEESKEQKVAKNLLSILQKYISKADLHKDNSGSKSNEVEEYIYNHPDCSLEEIELLLGLGSKGSGYDDFSQNSNV